MDSQRGGDSPATNQAVTSGQATDQRWPGCCKAGRHGAAGRQAASDLTSSWAFLDPRGLEEQFWHSGAVIDQHGSTAGPLGAGWRGGANPLRSMPLRLALARAEARLAVLAPGQCSPAGRVVGVLRTTPAMAIPQGPVCEVRLLVVHRYLPGVKKLGTAPRQVEFLGRRGKPVKKMRLIPAEKAFAFARKLQGTPGCTVSVC
jgi:hypothetical protein